MTAPLPDRFAHFAAAPARTTRGLALADDAPAPALAPAVARSAADLFATLPPAAEQRLLAVLAAPPAPGQSVEAAFRRKERDLCAVLGGLTVIEARGLHYRLSARREGDALAAAFARLAFERRARILDFLADARRRDARAHR